MALLIKPLPTWLLIHSRVVSCSTEGRAAISSKRYVRGVLTMPFTSRRHKVVSGCGSTLYLVTQ